MANTTNIDLKFRLSCPRRKFVSATTGHLGLNVLRMNVTFHDYFRNSNGQFRIKPPIYCTQTGKNERGMVRMTSGRFPKRYRFEI